MSDKKYIDDFISVPPIFYPEGKNEPFKHCKICDKELIESNEQYIIEKAFSQDLKTKDRELVFEFAYCLDCLDEIRSEFSKESREKIDEYFRNNTNLEKRYKGLTENNLFDVDIWLHNCIVKNKSIDEVEEYQILTLCQGSYMLFYHAPYMICGEAMDDIVNLISNKTLDTINDFWADNIDLPPEFEDIFKTRRPVIF